MFIAGKSSLQRIFQQAMFDCGVLLRISTWKMRCSVAMEELETTSEELETISPQKDSFFFPHFFPMFSYVIQPRVSSIVFGLTVSAGQRGAKRRRPGAVFRRSFGRRSNGRDVSEMELPGTHPLFFCDVGQAFKNI
jgi:hypothetical protein